MGIPKVRRCTNGLRPRKADPWMQDVFASCLSTMSITSEMKSGVSCLGLFTGLWMLLDSQPDVARTLLVGKSGHANAE